jgi:hypothetical protein
VGRPERGTFERRGGGGCPDIVTWAMVEARRRLIVLCWAAAIYRRVPSSLLTMTTPNRMHSNRSRRNGKRGLTKRR